MIIMIMILVIICVNCLIQCPETRPDAEVAAQLECYGHDECTVAQRELLTLFIRIMS